MKQHMSSSKRSLTCTTTRAKDHAVAMARFARDCRFRLKAVVNELELQLGPGTSDLDIRIGLHSGTSLPSDCRVHDP
jgi:class 3 adenylate cyclase